MTSKKQGKVHNVCVIGLSGYDIDEKRLYGIGKSCFCNRFARPKQDDYFPDHTSIYSTSDFVGTVLNNDHYLYWGSIEKVFDENTTVKFRVIEHTELIDDASYTPLSNDGSIAPYPKRATATKISSPGKIQYFSRDQVALQYDYDQIQMDRDGKVQVDGFICTYDVSKSFAEKQKFSSLQEDTISTLLTYINKTKKPVVIVATKCDDTTDQLLQKAHQFVNTKKISTPLVETSAELCINVDLGFQVLFNLIDTKSRFRAKLITFQEGLQIRDSRLAEVNKKYLSLIQSSTTDSSLLMSWQDFKKQQSETISFIEFTNILGLKQARLIFNQQAKKIKRHYEDKKLNEFLNRLPDALDELLPSLHAIEANDWKWENCQQAIKNHILFDKWLYVHADTWNSPERLFSKDSDNRIPFDVLQVERARACFDRHIKKLRESARKLRMKNEFRKLLELTQQIQPGTNWLDAARLLEGEESYKYLDEHDRKVIFEKYLRDITLRAKLDFQELLFESASKFSKLSKDASPSASEMLSIYKYLCDDLRYQRLENVGNARDILLFNHIALMQSPSRCLSGPDKCMDRLMQNVVDMTARRNVHNPYENEIFRDNEDELINLLVIGKDGLGEELEERIKIGSSSFDCVEVIVDGQIYGLNIKVFESESEHYEEELSLVVNEFKPQGYLAIYSQRDSFEFVDNCLTKLQEYDSGSQVSLPLIVMLANESGREGEIQLLRTKGQNMAKRLDCVFIDYPYGWMMDDRIHDSQVHDAMKRIVDVINKRARPASTPTGDQKETADIRILLCAMCGDEYPVELILSTMVQHQTCYSDPEQPDTIMLEASIDGVRKLISVTLGSYHRAYGLKIQQMFHGFILVYSATRLASLETLRAFASSLHSDVPVQVLAVTGSASGSSIIFHEENAMLFLNDGSTFAHKLHAKLQQSQNQCDNRPLFRPLAAFPGWIPKEKNVIYDVIALKTNFHSLEAGQFLTFFNTAYDRKTDTELILQGIKRRRQEPLPDVPALRRPSDLVTNGDTSPGMYASIGAPGVIPPDSPYVEVAVRHSYIAQDSDSTPSSPDRRRSSLLRDSMINRDRSSTIDSHEDVEHDDTGMYAKVNKHRYTYLKKVEKPLSDDDDDDDDLVWQDNMAYDPGNNIAPHRVSIASNLDSPQLTDRPYATVPFLPKNHKPLAKDYEKFATMPAKPKDGHGWNESKNTQATPPVNEPTYASIDQIKADMSGKHDRGYEADSMSSVSSRSKESTGSQLDITEAKNGNKKVPMVSPNSSSNLQQMWQLEKEKAAQKGAPPLAKPDDDESDEVKELRKKLEDNLNLRKTSFDKLLKSPRKEKKEKEKSFPKKQRSESNLSTGSLNIGFINKFMKAVSPNPSPGNSDIEPESETIPIETPKKKRLRGSFKKPKHSSSSSQNTSSNTTPAVVVNDADESLKDRSNTLPVQSPKHDTPKFASLDHKRNPKSLFKKHTSDSHGTHLQINTPDTERFQTQTLDRKKSKKLKLDRNKGTKDDLYLDLNTSSGSNTMDRNKKEKKSKQFSSMRFPKASRPRGMKKRESDVQKQLKQWQSKNEKNMKFKDSKYFGRPLKDICPADSRCPVLITSVIAHVEANGMQSEGIYRLSGNKHDIEAIMQKYEANPDINLQELGVSVHAVTGTLKQFFKMLPDPLIPYEFGSKINDIMIIMDAADRLKKLQALVVELPQPNLEVFRLFMCHLNRVTEHKDKNKMDTRNLQTVLYPTLLRPNFDSLQNMSQNMNMGLFIQTCIEQSTTIFPSDEKTPQIHADEKEEDNNDSGTNCDDMDGVENQPVTSELSFTESVLTDPGLVENVLMLPVNVEAKLTVEEDKIKKRRSMETEIF